MRISDWSSDVCSSDLDPRLIMEIAPRVAQAAMESGVAAHPIEDFEAYRQKLSQFVYRSGQVMRPVFERAREEPKRVVFAEGEEERVLRAVQTVLDERLAQPIRSEEHTSELQSLMRISYAVFCFEKKK